MKYIILLANTEIKSKIIKLVYMVDINGFKLRAHGHLEIHRRHLQGIREGLVRYAVRGVCSHGAKGILQVGKYRGYPLIRLLVYSGVARRK